MHTLTQKHTHVTAKLKQENKYLSIKLASELNNVEIVNIWTINSTEGVQCS